SQPQAALGIPVDGVAACGPRRDGRRTESDCDLLIRDSLGLCLVRDPLRIGMSNLRLGAAAILLAPAAASAQALVAPARLPASLKNFERAPNQPSVRCEVTPVKPTLDYGFRFGAGYVVHVPLNQYPGSGHRLTMLTRITPQGGDRKPVYLINVVRLP